MAGLYPSTMGAEAGQEVRDHLAEAGELSLFKNYKKLAEGMRGGERLWSQLHPGG